MQDAITESRSFPAASGGLTPGAPEAAQWIADRAALLDGEGRRQVVRNGSRKARLAMVFKLAEAAQKRWRKLSGHALIGDLIRGVRFIDGEKQQAA